MHGITPIQPAPLDAPQTDGDALERALLLCLEALASLSFAGGDAQRATRLRNAAAALRQDDGATDDTHPSELTPREWQVARLVGRGWSNRSIASELIVSERTVDTHVSHILRKLGLVSRAQIASWITVQTHSTLRGSLAPKPRWTALHAH
jgi:DNA-binding NarL/FixJ family response regulator